MLRFSCLVAAVVIGLTLFTCTESYQHFYHGPKDSQKGYNSLATLIKSKNMSEFIMPSDKDERTLVMPKMRTHVVVPKKRNIKKLPRRTIQKIIKKAKKNKKSFNQVTSLPTEPTRNEPKETTSTTQASQKKKVRKFNYKYARLPRPFQKLAPRRDMKHRRTKREADRERDLYILQDLDEIEFLSNEDDENAIITHVKKYW